MIEDGMVGIVMQDDSMGVVPVDSLSAYEADAEGVSGEGVTSRDISAEDYSAEERELMNETYPTPLSKKQAQEYDEQLAEENAHGVSFDELELSDAISYLQERVPEDAIEEFVDQEMREAKRALTSAKRAKVRGKTVDERAKSFSERKDRIRTAEARVKRWANIKEGITSVSMFDEHDASTSVSEQLDKIAGASSQSNSYKELDMRPTNAVELAAYLLVGRRRMRLIYKDFIKHTGYSHSEARKLFGIFASKEKGGISFERFGEEIIWANDELAASGEINGNLIDADDTMAGVNAALELFHSVRSRGDLYRLLREGAEMRSAEEAKAIDDAEAEFIYEAYHMSVEEYEAWSDQMKEKEVSLQEYEELQTQIAEDYDKRRTQEDGGRRAEPLSVNEQRGEDRISERSSDVLHGERAGDRRGNSEVENVGRVVESAGAESGSAQDAGYVKNDTFAEDGISERISQASDGAQDGESGEVVKEPHFSQGGFESSVRDAQAHKGELSEREIADIAEVYAKDANSWVPLPDQPKLGAPLPSGVENEAYYNELDGFVYKVNNLSLSKNILSFLERINLHNKLFPETQYELIGFTGFGNGSVYPIVRQRFIPNAEFATPEEIDSYMRSLGFEKTSKEAEYSNGEYVISDLRPRNVLKDADGDIYVIDAGLEVAASVSDQIAEEREKVDLNLTEGQKEAGWFERVLSEQRLPNERTKSKIKGVAEEFVGEDERRPILIGVLHKGGKVYASDGAALISEEAKYPKKDEGKTLSKKEGEIKGKYPNVESVIPKGIDYVSFDADELVSFVERVETAVHAEWNKKDENGKRLATYKQVRSKTAVVVRVNGSDLIVRFDQLDRVAKAARRLKLGQVCVTDRGVIHMTDGTNHLVLASYMSEDSFKSNHPDFAVFAHQLTDDTEDVRFRAGLSETDEIIAKAKADGTYMKAPNGNPTNLSEKQWAQVRTKAFKEWFGDWEKKAKFEGLKQRINGRKKQQQVEYSDEFRRVQEGSRALSERDISEYQGGKRHITKEAGFGILQLGLRGQLNAQSNSGGNARRSFVDKKGNQFNIIEDIHGQIFHDIFEIVRNYLKNGELVDLHDNYDNCVCYITEDGLSGFAVEENGNLVSVFNLNPYISFLSSIKDYVTECGATHLDGYNSKAQPLAEIYKKTLGWQVASMMDYNMEYDHDNIAENHGSPQVAFMVNTPDSIQERAFDKDSYDKAEAYQLEQRDISLNNTSKVVDENGEPMVVYHGTPYVFTAFDRTKIGQTTDAGWLGRGFYFFGNNKAYASQYAKGGTVMQVFLNVRDPYFASVQEVNSLAEINSTEASTEFTNDIQEEGHDGVFYNGDLNGEWVALSPDQIKSATDNVGTFDVDNPDIRFRRSDTPIRESDREVFARGQISSTIPDGFASTHFVYEPNLAHIYEDPTAYYELEKLAKENGGILPEGWEYDFSPEDFRLKNGYVCCKQSDNYEYPQYIMGAGDDSFCVFFEGEKVATIYDGVVAKVEKVLDVWERKGGEYVQVDSEDVRYRAVFHGSPHTIDREERRLFAVHNLSEESLRKGIELGGFPMPSIAITDVGIGHSDYGEISLLFDKSSINPSDRRNKVYSGDAWTPTFPEIGMKIDMKVAEKIKRTIESLLPDYNYINEYRLRLDGYNIDDSVNGSGSFANAYKGNTAMKIAFLKQAGIPFRPVVKEKAGDILVIDGKATRERAEKKFTKKVQSEYEAWLESLSEGIIEKRGIRNDRDPFTPSGNRRSWEACRTLLGCVS